MGKAEHGLENSDGDIPSLEDFDHNDDMVDDADSNLFEDQGEEGDGNGNGNEELDEEEHSRLLDDTSAVRDTVSKVRTSLLSISLTQLTFFFGSFDSFLSQSFIQLLSPSRHGGDSARSTGLPQS
jgi:hypothetical protein